MSEQTITIPADLNANSSWRWSPVQLRDSAHGAERAGLPVTASLLCFLADEIERQAPRKVGWYFIESEGATSTDYMAWYCGQHFHVGKQHGPVIDILPGDTVKPVTIGVSS